MVDIRAILDYLVTFGFYEIILPFLAVFVIAYGILQTTKVLSEKNGVNAVTALVIAMFMTWFARVYKVGDFLGAFLGKSGIMLIILLVVMMASVFIYRTLSTNQMIPAGKELLYGVGVLLLVGSVVFLFLNSIPGTWMMLFGKEGLGIDTDLIVGVVVLAGIIGFVGWVITAGT